jgi:hypothetical protein
MKKHLIFGLLCMALLPLAAQTNLTHYQYWFDGNFGNAVLQAVTPAQQVNIQYAISTSALSNGPHIFYMRFLDVNGRWSSPTSQFFYKAGGSTSTNSSIVGYEFWFDNNYSAKTSLTLSATQQADVVLPVSTSTLSNGPHIFYMRFLDDNGRWGSPLSQFFYKAGGSTGTNSSIVGYEYWFDNNYSAKTSQTLSATQQADVVLPVSTSTLSNGPHIFYMRFLDDNSRWSSPMSQFFYKAGGSTGTNSSIVGYEFWFDNNYTAKTSQTLNPNQQADVVLPVSTSGISNGPHIFYMRFLDDNGRWGSPITQFFYKSAFLADTTNLITAYRYWFDGDTALMAVKAISSPAALVLLLDTLDMRHIWKGTHIVSLQFKDGRGQWSVPVSDTVVKQSVPLADFSFATIPGCDSTVVAFANQSIDGEAFSWNFGNGLTSVLENPQVSYTQPGSYAVSLTITDTLLNISHTKTDTVQIISGINYASLVASACNSYTSPSGNFVYTQSGQYTDTLVNYWGCDSILSITLTINSAHDSTWAVSACSQYVSPWGITYGQSGQYVASLQTIKGCDSTIHLNLNLIHVDTAVVVSTTMLTAAQNGANYQWVDCNNNYASISGATAQTFLPAQNGSYAVIILYNGCTDTSQCKAITQISIVEWGGSQFRLYPNPASQSIEIEFLHPQKQVGVEIYSMNGTCVHRVSLKDVQSMSTSFNLPEGVYVVLVRTNMLAERVRLVVKP